MSIEVVIHKATSELIQKSEHCHNTFKDFCRCRCVNQCYNLCPRKLSKAFPTLVTSLFFENVFLCIPATPSESQVTAVVNWGPLFLANTREFLLDLQGYDGGGRKVAKSFRKTLNTKTVSAHTTLQLRCYFPGVSQIRLRRCFFFLCLQTVHNSGHFMLSRCILLSCENGRGPPVQYA